MNEDCNGMKIRHVVSPLWLLDFIEICNIRYTQMARKQKQNDLGQQRAQMERERGKKEERSSMVKKKPQNTV